jgi:hypothetical protein
VKKRDSTRSAEKKLNNTAKEKLAGEKDPARARNIKGLDGHLFGERSSLDLNAAPRLAK